MTRAYVHGYAPREAQRLLDQAGTLADLLHHDTAYPAGSRVLEAGCGVGAAGGEGSGSSCSAGSRSYQNHPSSPRR
jgi:hypothetical protein